MALNLKFKKITLHNFGSYGHATANLEDRGFCLVTGRNNFKKDNALSNGSGKSMLWSGICFALTGETLQGLHNNIKNINVDENECYVAVEFDNWADSYTVVRYIAPKSDLKIMQNDKDVSGKGLRESEKKLGELLPELTAELISSTILIGQGMPNAFSKFSPSGRKDMLEKLTKSDFMIEDVKNRLSCRQSELDKQVRILEDSLLLNGSQLANDRKSLDILREEELGKVRPDFDAMIKAAGDRITLCQKDIAAAKNEESAFEKELKDTSDKLLAQTSEKSEWTKKLQEEFNARYTPLIERKASCETSIMTKKAEISRLKNVKDKCPTCGRPFEGVVKPDTSSQEKELEEMKKLLEDIKSSITRLNAKATENQEKLNGAYDADISGLKRKDADIRNKLNKCRANINTLVSRQTAESAEKIKLEYERDGWDTARRQAVQRVDSLTKSIANLTSVSASLEKDKANLQEHQAVVKKMKTLSERDFRGYLLTNVIDYLDKKAKEYCKVVFGTEDLSVYLDGNALDISYCGKLIDCLSGGEKQRVDLILQLAIRDLLSNYFNFSSNILVLDEITDFLDANACSAIFDLVNKTLINVESVFVVSHHAADLGLQVDTELRVVKNEDGISEILQ